VHGRPAFSATRADRQTALSSQLARADNQHFLERFRYSIVASQLLAHQPHNAALELDAQARAPLPAPFSLQGAGLTATVAFVVAYMTNWARCGTTLRTLTARVLLVLAVFVGSATMAYSYLQRQWLHFLRRTILSECGRLLAAAQSLDACIAATLTHVQEVELVSRGYKL
jgi:hypothetical protein